ncbi:MAG: hypothetical protein Kow00123_26100 [Anaerolineales bacterium]
MKRKSDLPDARIRLLFLLLAILSLGVYNVFTYSTSHQKNIAYWDRSFTDPPSVREYYLEALQIAQQWRQDAQLVDADVQFYPQQWHRQPRVALVFRGTDSLYASLILHYIDGSVEQEEITQTTPWQVRPIGSNEWELDTSDVLEIAQNNGGRAFLSEHPGAEVWVQLGRYGPVGTSGVWWLVKYIDFSSREDCMFAIDAVSGRIGYSGSVSGFQDWRLSGTQ